MTGPTMCMSVEQCRQLLVELQQRRLRIGAPQRVGEGLGGWPPARASAR